MRRISYWAHRHPWPARILIVLIHLALLFLALQLGNRLSNLQVRLSSGWLLAAAVLFLSAVLIYPGKSGNKSSGRQLRYAWQKSCDLALVASSFFAMTILGNLGADDPVLTGSSRASFSSIPVDHPELLSPNRGSAAHEIIRSDRKKLRATLRTEWKRFKQLKKEGRSDEAGEAILIVLTVLVALGLTILLASLSCSISCGGAEGLAILVFVLGLAGIVLGSIALIRMIQRKRRQAPPSNAHAVADNSRGPDHKAFINANKIKNHDLFIQGLSAGGS